MAAQQDWEASDWAGQFAASLPDEVEEAARALAEGIRQPLAAGDPRRHHYVPQFLLRRFASDDSIARVHLSNADEHVVGRVGDVAVMKDLYTTIDEDVGETVAVEKLLAVIDGEAAPAVARLAMGVLYPPQPADRLALAMWLGLQTVRGPHMRRRWEALADHSAKLELSLVTDEASARTFLRQRSNDPPTDDEVSDLLDWVAELDRLELVPHQNQFVQMMLDSGLALAPAFFSRFWALVRFKSPGLILTDNPVVLYQRPENHHPFMGIGYGTADEVWVPLDRRNALVLHSEPLVGERIIEGGDDSGVDDFNQAVVAQAHQEVFCHPDDIARLQRLELPSAERPLWNVTGGWADLSTDGVNAPPERRKHRRYRGEDGHSRA